MINLRKQKLRFGINAQLTPLDLISTWDQLVDECIAGTAFHQRDVLMSLGITEVISYRQNNQIVAALPILKTKSGQFSQDTRFIPYLGPIFKPISTSSRRMMNFMREIWGDLIAVLQHHYHRIDICMNHEIKDIVPFIQAGFLPEIRYTYLIDLEHSSASLKRLASKGRRYDLVKAKTEQVCIVRDDEVNNDLNYDVTKSAQKFKSGNHEEQLRGILAAFRKTGRCRVFFALNAEQTVMGSLCMVWDAQNAYSILSYYLDEYAKMGVPTLLYYSAITYAKDVLQLKYFDLEGSVLPGIEKFYQSFGGTQAVYYNVHWRKKWSSDEIKAMYIYE